MKPSFTVDSTANAWPGATVGVTLTPDRDTTVAAVKWQVAGTVHNDLGSSSWVKLDEATVAVDRAASPDRPLSLDVPVSWRFPPPMTVDEIRFGWRFRFWVDTPDGKVEVAHEPTLVPALPGITAATLVDENEAAELLKKRARTTTSVGSVGFVVILLLAMALAFPIGAVLADGEAEGVLMVGLTMLFVGALHLGNWLLYGKVDRLPFELDQSTARVGGAVRATLVSPAEVALVAGVLTRTQQSRGVGSRTKTTVHWSSGPLTRLDPGALASDVSIPASLRPTVQASGARVDHWVRIQPESSAGSDERFQRRRSDRPVIVLA